MVWAKEDLVDLLQLVEAAWVQDLQLVQEMEAVEVDLQLLSEVDLQLQSEVDLQLQSEAVAGWRPDPS